MSADRFLLIVGDGKVRSEWRSRLRKVTSQLSLSIANEPGFLLATARPPWWFPKVGDARGAIVGSVFDRGTGTAMTCVSSEDAHRIVATNGMALINRFWGDYIAILPGTAGVSVVRSPAGALPCYFSTAGHATLMASDIALLEVLMEERPSVNWEAVTLELIAPGIPRPETCLTRVSELAGGERLRLGDQPPRRDTLWSPWSFAADPLIPERNEAADRLRTTIIDVVTARAGTLGSTVLLLSGGVDSSIVAAALAETGRADKALTMVTRDAASDEREHARIVARHCGLQLSEVVRDARIIDLTHSEAAGLPYPSATAFSQATHAAARDLIGSDAACVIHGGGGDQIFCSVQSAAPLADLIRARGLGREAFDLMIEIATLGNATAAAVFAQAIRRLVSGRHHFSWPARLDCLTPAARSRTGAALEHLWLTPPPGIGSGSASHAALTMSALEVLRGPGLAARPPRCAILVAQPVIETCLSIPSWLWYERGRNRAVARCAFENRLPPGHIWRQGKGAMSSFMIEIFEAYRPLLREMIIDGMLVRQGLVDREACLAIIDDPCPIRGERWARILHFADVEAWAASWR